MNARPTPNTNTNTNTNTNGGWNRRDVWLGLLFLGMGGLLAVYVVVAIKNGFPIFFWGTGCLLAVLFLLLGGNAVVRSLRSGK